VAGADGTKGEVAISHFPGDVGGDLANVNRWRQQVALPPIDEAGLAVSTAFGYDVSLQTDPATGSRSVTVSAGNERLSMGDAHFVQILTGAEIRCDNPVSSNQLVHAKGPEGIALDCSSSWFTYARTTPCQVACFYCETAYRSRVWGEVGCVPLALTSLLSSKLREVS
jgi:hypothetical protein